MSNEKTWAEYEVELACAKERELAKKDGNEEDANYGIACYQSALKAYKTLMEDGHSGASIEFTKGFLMRLIDGKPLTPIEDTEDMWFNPPGIDAEDENGDKSYLHKRMSSLCKYIYNNGTIRYSDINRVYCAGQTNPNVTYRSSFITRIIDELFPITMPYYPTGYFKVYTEDLLTDKKNGDFDTMGVLYAIQPDGTRVDIFRYFKEVDHKWSEIDETEYQEREKIAVAMMMEDKV